jgi:hypothetical protein
VKSLKFSTGKTELLSRSNDKFSCLYETKICSKRTLKFEFKKLSKNEIVLKMRNVQNPTFNCLGSNFLKGFSDFVKENMSTQKLDKSPYCLQRTGLYAGWELVFRPPTTAAD